MVAKPICLGIMRTIYSRLDHLSSHSHGPYPILMTLDDGRGEGCADASVPQWSGKELEPEVVQVAVGSPKHPLPVPPGPMG